MANKGISAGSLTDCAANMDKTSGIRKMAYSMSDQLRVGGGIVETTLREAERLEIDVLGLSKFNLFSHSAVSEQQGRI